MNVGRIDLVVHPPMTGFRSQNEFELQVASVMARVDWKKVAKAVNEQLPKDYKVRIKPESS